MSQLTCSNLTIGYEGRSIASNINFSAECGDYICIVGENGSGKSTLVKTILNLNAPLSGSVKFGNDIKRSEIGYLPQQTEIQKDFPASVSEIVMSGFLPRHKIFPFYSRAEKNEAAKQMKRLEIDELSERCYRELSGGQQQRVFLARSLCAAEKMIILDEPVTGLDPRVTAEMYEIISEINKKDKITVIMVSHDVRAAVKYSSHILHIGHSDSFYGTVSEYFNSEIGQRFML